MNSPTTPSRVRFTQDMTMTIDTNRQLVIRLFEENIYPHIIGDLKLLDDIQPKTHGNGCAIPTAMLILSSLDFIGYLLSPTGKLNDTKGNITTALNYGGYFSATYTPDIIHDLVIYYRHGLMHTFYPKQTAKKIIYGIHKSDNLLLLENLDCQEYKITSLSNEYLIK